MWCEIEPLLTVLGFFTVKTKHVFRFFSTMLYKV